MFKKFIFIVLIIFLTNESALPCTNFIVTKGASTDGSVHICYTADSFTLYGELYYFPAAKYPEGTWLDIYDWDTGKYLGRIKQARETYNVVGNMNEYQVVIGETTFGGREELINKKGILDYGSLMYIALQRSKTAREAIKIMTDLVEEYGYYSSGESFSIADANEAWILEMIGKGEGRKGAVWVAVRIPDGYVSAHANHARITKINFNDPDNYLYSKDVVSFAREMGYFNGRDEDFSFSDVYAPLDFGAIRFCEARVWSLFRRVNKDMEKYISYIRGESLERMPLYIKPDQKLSLADVKKLMRDHYEGTELDITKGIASGWYNTPVRWRPLVWEYEGNQYFNERPISTPQTGFSFVSQARSYLPREVGGVLWFGVDDTYFTVWVPMYSSITKIPYNFQQGLGSLNKYHSDAAFWIFNFVSNYAYPKFSIVKDDIQKVQSELEGKFHARQKSIEDAAQVLLKESQAKAIDYLTNYSNEMAKITIERWRKLGEDLIVKYLDGIKKNEYGNPVNIGYSKEFKKYIVEESGDKYKMKKLPTELDEEYASAIKNADSLLKSKKYDEAKKEFQKALSIKPEDESVKSKLNKIEELLKRIDELHKENFEVK
ncbi:MAG: C69 family dipeptidase [Ignavibacterium sp.]|nr:C69 family dipeptidase [Ignavibacterium sp.]MDW8374863.1 C69 family dipeptidase [Ignavibacteriales bacterium]